MKKNHYFIVEIKKYRKHPALTHTHTPAQAHTQFVKCRDSPVADDHVAYPLGEVVHVFGIPAGNHKKYKFQFY